MKGITREKISHLTNGIECTVKDLTRCFRVLDGRVMTEDVRQELLPIAKQFYNEGSFTDKTDNLPSEYRYEHDLIRFAFILRNKPKNIGVYSDKWIKMKGDTRQGWLVISEFLELFNVFNLDSPKLLKFGIEKDIKQKLNELPQYRINKALFCYTTRALYRALKPDGPRYDLDGNEVAFERTTVSLSKIIIPVTANTNTMNKDNIAYDIVFPAVENKDGFFEILAITDIFLALVQQGIQEVSLNVYSQ